MLGKNIEPEEKNECPECAGKMVPDGDKYAGTATCEQCGYSEKWDICNEMDV